MGVKAEIEVEEAAPAPVAATVHIHLTDEASDRVVNAHVGDKLSSLDGWQESPKRDGYTFKGWNTKADGTGDTVTGDTKVPTPYFSVWAQWEPKAQAKIEAQDATITADQIAGKDWDEQVAMARKALVKSATDASGKDAKGDVELTFMKDGSNGWYAFSQAETGDYQVVLTLGGVSKTVKLTVEEAEPQAPAVDVSQLLNTYGTVSYKVQGGTQDGSAPYLDATKVDATAGTPEKQVDGTWRVTLKLKANDKLATALLVHDWELPEGTTADDFQVDEQGSTLTATFETTSPTGTSWYLVPGQGIEVSFVKKAVRATVHLFYGFKSDEHPTSDGEVVLSSGNVGDKLSTLYSWEETPTRDGYTFKGWNTKADGTGETVTGATAIPTGWYALYAQWEKKAAPANPSKPGQGEQGGTTTPEQKPEQGPAGTANKMDGKDGVRAPAQKKAAAEKSSKDGNAPPQTGDSSMTVVSAAAVAGVAALVGGAEILRRRAQN